MTPRLIKVGSRKHGNGQVTMVQLSGKGWVCADGGSDTRLVMLIGQLAKRGFATQFQEVIS